MTPIAAKALVALCICPPAVMTALVATSPPARTHAANAIRSALRQAPAPAPAPAVVASTPPTGNCDNLPRFAALSVPLDETISLPSAALANNLIGAGNVLPPGVIPNLAPPAGPSPFAPAPPAITDLLPLSGAPDLDQWLQMMVGFALLGSTVRVRRRSQA